MFGSVASIVTVLQVSNAGIMEIIELVKGSHYQVVLTVLPLPPANDHLQLACTKHFQLTHPGVQG